MTRRTLSHHIILPPFDDGLPDAVSRICEAVFGSAEPHRIRWRLTHMPDASVLAVRDGEQMVAFKAGYAVSDTKYYSWLGGVLPDYRRRGLASALMERQHAWLRARGYGMVETATNQDNRAMAAANLKHGFLIAGTRRNPDNTQILFLKALDAQETDP